MDKHRRRRAKWIMLLGMFSELGWTFTVSEATALGVSYKQLLGERRRGTIIQLRTGVYCTSATWQRAQGQEAALHALYVEAVQKQLRFETWASDYSAAQLFGWPAPRREVSSVVLTAEPKAAPTRVATGMRITPAGVPEEHRDRIHGVPVLSRPRTIVDIARRHGLAAGLVVADAALRVRELYTPQLAAAIEACAGWPGIRAARLVAQHASWRRESPLESKSFAHFVAWGLPLPLCNSWLDLADRARVDFLWRLYRVVGEADGRVKYDHPFGTAENVLWKEKVRADAIEEAGFVLTRWTGPELERTPEVVRERILRAFKRAHVLYGVPPLR